MGLTTYKTKRDFKQTSEPKGKTAKGKNGALNFVIQKHDATHLHYDFRLELDGVLKSWAIPKGPSLNPKDKRLAVQVEDHPLEYGKFQGKIPEGNYGAGTVEIWDKGIYELDPAYGTDGARGLRKGLESGSLKFVLHGRKLNGSFALVRLKYGKGNNWLLIKHRDEFAQDAFDIEQASNNSPAKKIAKPKSLSVRSAVVRERKIKDFVAPMLATLTDKAFDDLDWIFEMKWDGYRAIAEINGKSIKLYSRNGLSFIDLYPIVADELTKIKGKFVLDGEIVILDDDGKPSFQKLQHYPENRRLAIVYYVFDCLKFEGKNITNLALIERKKLLSQIIPKSDIIRYSEHVEADGIAFFREAVKLKLEGIMAKHKLSTYEKGKRTTNWLKIKNTNTQEAIIAGYTAPRASRKYFGALILAIKQKGKLKYIGHSGTGFTEKVLKDLYTEFQPLVRASSPFSEKIPANASVTWLRPALVCNVKYTELTQDGIMRHPIFLGLRIDKNASEVDHVDRKKTALAKPNGVKPRLRSKKEDQEDESIKVNGHSVKITNRSKVYWPEEGYTKGQVIDFYHSIAPYILPYLKDRPQSLRRNPNGISDKGFFHKDAGDAAPSWVKHASIHAQSSNKNVEYILCNNEASLLYLNNLGCIEINPWNSRIKKPDNPDYLIIDLDPSESNSFDEVIDVAHAVKEVLDKAGASSYCKTSGATGVHIYVPLHALYTYEQIKPFAELVAITASEIISEVATIQRSLIKRKGRIYIDYLQNSRGQTLSSVYSLRPVPGASVSTPLDWKELKHGLNPLDFNINNIGKRLAKKGDLFKGVLKDKINLKRCFDRLGQ
ncbi:MAG: DNA ligase D [Chryseolinea sp.]